MAYIGISIKIQHDQLSLMILDCSWLIAVGMVVGWLQHLTVLSNFLELEALLVFKVTKLI